MSVALGAETLHIYIIVQDGLMKRANDLTNKVKDSL